MSLLVAIQSAIFYYVACTPCNEARARYRAKQQAKNDREEKLRIQMEQPGLYRHPSPFHTNPYWKEEIEIGPKPPKSKMTSRNTSQRGLTSSSTGRNSTSASLTCTSSHNELSSTSPGSPTMIPEDASLSLQGDDWNKRRYQREDEELWGHDLTRMGHKLVDNIVKAGSSAGRMIKGELASKDKEITDEDRTNFYFTPKNPPVNDYHPPIVGSAPAHKDAFQWMLQPPPPAKIMEGKVPVNRTQSFHSSASRRSANQKAAATTAKPASSDELPLDRVVRDRAMPARLVPTQETPSESELIEVLIGRRSSRARSMSHESAKCSDPSTDSELVDRRRRARARTAAYAESDDSESDADEDHLALHASKDSPSRGRGTLRAAQRPKLGTIRASNSAASRKALASMPNGTRPESVTPRPASPMTVLKPGLATGFAPPASAFGQAKDENTPVVVAS